MSEEAVETDSGQEEIEGIEEFEDVPSLSRDETRQTLYALLFSCNRPMGATRLAEALGDLEPEVAENLLAELKSEINGQDRLPYELKEVAGGYQLVSKPAYAPYIRRLLQLKRSKKLSRAVLETLAIIAYKQPTTRAEVESIRGVSVSHAFDQLQERRLIKVSGVADLPGRPKLYRTTDDFLLQFGLKSLKELPTLDEVREMD
jgi:segregation and condensation protein B